MIQTLKQAQGSDIRKKRRLREQLCGIEHIFWRLLVGRLDLDNDNFRFSFLHSMFTWLACKQRWVAIRLSATHLLRYVGNIICIGKKDLQIRRDSLHTSSHKQSRPVLIFTLRRMLNLFVLSLDVICHIHSISSISFLCTIQLSSTAMQRLIHFRQRLVPRDGSGKMIAHVFKIARDGSNRD